jgi:spore coat polysaccharide biosynthesis protein SpsF (cytidylyltransferase family)
MKPCRSRISPEVGAAIIIFSRFDSRRLPGKALIDIGGRPLLGRVIDRARLVDGAPFLILATSDRPVDDALADFAAAENVAVFRGDVDDVAGRALACARRFGIARFARLCGDRVFFDPGLVGRLIALQAASGADVATTAMPSTWPPGLTSEVIATEALARALELTSDPYDREHVTSFFYKRPDLFRIESVTAPQSADFTGVRLVVDDEVDLARARWMCAQFPSPATAPLESVVSAARRWQDLSGGGVITPLCTAPNGLECARSKAYAGESTE